MARANIRDIFSKSFWASPKQEVKESPNAAFGYGGSYRTLFSQSFNGEKNQGEMNPITNYVMDYSALRLRSWQAYIESEIAQTVIKKYVAWVVGNGLKLQAEPSKSVLESEGIFIDTQDFANTVEARFSIWASSQKSDYAGMTSMNEIQKVALTNALLGGDVVVIQRYEKDCLNVQLVDGAHLYSPVYGDEWFPYITQSGNRIVSGIEMNSNNEHIAFHLKKPGLGLETVRIDAKSKDGFQRAFIVYGSRYRLDTQRGIPLMTTVLQTLTKLERYDSATLSSAEERAKIVYQIVHKEFSTGESPLTNQLAKAFDADANVKDKLPSDDYGTTLANTVAASTNKSTYNMPNGAEMKALESKNELYFKDFYTVHIDIICACLGIPPDVAFSKYDENYSASRAAIKDWEHTLSLARKDFSNQFLRPIYTLFIHTEVLKNKVKAEGYIQAFLSKNWMVMEAYLKARFVGAAVPHIDPEKEVRAERLKLGVAGDAIPLTTVEAATEALNGGDSESNIDQFARELEKAKSLKIEIPMPVPAGQPPKKEGN